MTTVLISGSNRGLGLEFVRQYAADGCDVIATCRTPQAASAAALNEIAKASAGRVTVHALDVGLSASVAALKAELGARAIDILIANAGVNGGDRQHRLGDIDYDAWLHVFNINSLGPIRLAEAFAGNLKAGSDRKLIAITSAMGSTAENGGGFFAYRSSKAALNNIWKGVSLALKGEAIVCVAMHPGWVKTDMGGPSAHLEPKASVAGMRKVIAGLNLGDTGTFLRFDGGELPW
jgi:NAD(P)-dependent dehydrogenase (short-subunit alcohol dehydrogenase family)